MTSDEIYVVVAIDGDNNVRPVAWRPTKVECERLVALLETQHAAADATLRPWRARIQQAWSDRHDPMTARYQGGGGRRHPDGHPSHAAYMMLAGEACAVVEAIRTTLADPRVLGHPRAAKDFEIGRDIDELWYHDEYRIWRVPPEEV